MTIYGGWIDWGRTKPSQFGRHLGGPSQQMPENERAALESQDVNQSLADIFSGSQSAALITSRRPVANAGVKRSPEVAELDISKMSEGREAAPPKVQKHKLGGLEEALLDMDVNGGPARNEQASHPSTTLQNK